MSQKKNPRVLIVTPEVTYLPEGMGNLANYLCAKAGGLADVSAALISALFKQGADVHVALPDYRTVFADKLPPMIRKGRRLIYRNMPNERIHLAADRAFYYIERIYSYYEWENTKIALPFQREVINNIVPKVKPDLIHCNDWMTGLIPAMARQMGIPCLFTLHNVHTVKTSLAHIENIGIDAAAFWNHLYYQNIAYSYEETRETNPVDMLISGIFAAHYVNTVSPTFLKEIVKGQHDFITASLREELTHKWNVGCAFGILNAADPSFNPKRDPHLCQRYSAENHFDGKLANKRFLQKKLNLIQDDQAPFFFWPSRLDNVQKGCQLLTEILYSVISTYWNEHLEVIFVANGEFQKHFKDIVRFHGLEKRIAVCDFDDKLAHQAYAASDFILMPSRFEPCGLPQMIGPIYGSLPVAHDTGGIHDTIAHLDLKGNTGSGFLFETFDSGGLFWAVQQAMDFYHQPQDVKNKHVERIMRNSIDCFSHQITAQHYIELYEKMLNRPLLN